MRYTPDGTTGYFVNFDPSVGGASIFQVNLSTHATASWPPFNPLNQAPIFDDVMIAGSSRIFAFSSASTTLLDVQPSPLSAAAGTLTHILPTATISTPAISH